MIDQGEQDDKIIGVHADDPEYRDYTDISELPAHRLIEIRRQVMLYCSIADKVQALNSTTGMAVTYTCLKVL